jgi:hypothetical protein
MAVEYEDTDWFRGARFTSPDSSGATFSNGPHEHARRPVHDLALPEWH